jgi:hypothetical protein
VISQVAIGIVVVPLEVASSKAADLHGCEHIAQSSFSLD